MGLRRGVLNCLPLFVFLCVCVFTVRRKRKRKPRQISMKRYAGGDGAGSKLYLVVPSRRQLCPSKEIFRNLQFKMLWGRQETRRRGAGR